MNPAYKRMQSYFPVPGLLTLVSYVFVIILALRCVAFGFRLRILVQNKVWQDVKLFVQEYWEWKHLTANLLGLALGLSSLVAFIVATYLAHKYGDLPITESFFKNPPITIFIGLSLVSLLIYAAYRSIEQQKNTVQMCDGLKALRAFRLYKNSIRALQGVGWMQEGAGLFVNMGLSALHWASDHLVDRMLEPQVRKEVIGFMFEVGIEYALRVIVLVLALFLTQGRI